MSELPELRNLYKRIKILENLLALEKQKNIIYISPPIVNGQITRPISQDEMKRYNIKL